MQKRKLDLNHLLAKYQGASQTAIGSPTRQPRERYIEEEFYQYPQNSRTYQDPHPLPQRPNPNQLSRTTSNNFAMSKSQVQAYLLSLRDEVRGEEQSVNRQVEASLKLILQNFQRNSQKLRRELLDMMERAFVENERAIKQELARLSKTQSPEFAIVFRKISSLDQDIERLLSALRGPEYKKVIAQVVTRDFNGELNEVRGISSTAKNAYAQSLGEVQFDRSRVDAIKDNLQKLFFISKRNTLMQGNTLIQGNTHIHEVGSSIFSMVRDQQPQPQSQGAQSRTRKSFFNFGSD